MPFERIVVNASPLICLFKSGLQDLLPLIFQHIVVPTAVINEVTAHDKKDFPAHPIIAQGWLNSVADTRAPTLGT